MRIQTTEWPKYDGVRYLVWPCCANTVGPANLCDHKAAVTATVADLIALANDETKGHEVRELTDDEVSTWAEPKGHTWQTWTGYSPDYFSYDELTHLLEEVGIPAYVEQTGGGCATIYAGPLFAYHHTVWRAGKPTDETEIEWRHVVAAGPGNYGWDQGPSIGNIGEFYVGPNDEGETEGVTTGDLAPTNTRQLAALIGLYVLDAADFDNVTAIGLDGTQRGIPQIGA